VHLGTSAPANGERRSGAAGRTGDPQPMEELGRRVERWVEAGVIGREQGDAILALEAEPGGGRRAVAVEVLGY
jgi:hypothetical protein